MSLPTTKTSQMAPRGRCPVRNIYQGPAPRVLCVCSAGLLRSPTLALILAEVNRYNTRAVGANLEYALIPLNEQLMEWADVVIFADPWVKEYAAHSAGIDLLAWKDKILTLDIADRYSFMQPELAEVISEYLPNITGFVDKAKKGFYSNYD